MLNSSLKTYLFATIPTNASTSNYLIFVSINSARNPNGHSESTFTKIDIAQKSPDSISQQIDWDGVWILFSAYLILGAVLKIIYLSLT